MTVRVGINGFGRIGRNVLRSILEVGRTDIEVVAINDLGPIETNAHLLRFDSIHGRFPGTVKIVDGGIDAGNGPIKVTAERDPAKLPWANVDIALECTGIFTDRDKAKLHLQNGSKRVLVSAPASGADITVVYGVNHESLSANHLIVSNASCTTNCLAPVAMVLDKGVGIENGFMTTIHSYTGDQRTVDQTHSDFRRARGAAISMIPTSTGAAKALSLVLPKLRGKLDGTAIRVPTPNVSLIDLTFTSKKKTSVEEINKLMVQASKTKNLKNILTTNKLPLVSIDFNHNSSSSVFDLTQTQVLNGKFCRVLSWYDNEWGFSNRMIDTMLDFKKLL